MFVNVMADLLESTARRTAMNAQQMFVQQNPPAIMKMVDTGAYGTEDEGGKRSYERQKVVF